jgi:hypothetical protein
MMMENYYGSILEAQTHGATLMVEALKYRDADPQFTAPEGFIEDAEYFMAWHNDHIEDQVEIFLNETEQFIASTAYPQKGFLDFVPEADKIFYRADLIAAWLSPRHRLKTSDPNGQEFLVYRVFGGPDRVNQYGLGFPSLWGSPYTSILYDAPGTVDQYDIPDYTQTAYHAYSGLRSGTSPYVQFMHPLDNGGARQKGAIADADEIRTGKYVLHSPTGDEQSFPVPYYLDDMPTHKEYPSVYNFVNSAGQAPQSGDDKILFGYCLDIQHPPAILMGDWQVGLSQNTHSGLDSFSDSYNGSSTPGSQYVYLSVDAWPTVDRQSNGYSDWYNLSGSFTQEETMTGTYYWAGSSSHIIKINYTADMEWEVDNNGSPSDRLCGTLLSVFKPGEPFPIIGYPDYDYHYVGSGTDSGIQGGASWLVSGAGGQYDITLGPHMSADWNDKTVSSNDDWHHWQANYKLTLKDWYFTLSQ